MPGKFYALVVGINDYPSSPLRGCVHDALAMAELLEQRISEEHLELEILLDQQATRQGVVDAFRRHLGQARDGDQAFFFFAGHGSREQAPPELEHLEPDGMNETLVLQDSRQIGSRDLADKELGWLITELTRDHSPHVIVILDSCHSGDATRQGDGAGEGEDPSIAVRRGANDERPRPIESYLFYDSAVGIAPALATLEGAVGPQTWSLVPAPGKQSTEGFDPLAAEGRDHHVLLSACRSSELAQERMVGDQMRGLFSLYLVHALSRIDANATYRDLLMQVRTQVHLANPRQWPQATGDLRGRIFDGLVIPRPQTFTVRPTPAAGGHWRLNAGAVHGMQVDSELAVFPEDRLDTRDLSQALATLRITRVRTAESELALVRGEMPRAAGALPAVVTQLPLPPLIVSVPETAVGDEASELLRAFRIKVRSSPVLGLEPRGEAWVEVRLQDGFARLVRPGASDPIDPLPVKYPEDWQPILDRLEHIARWRVVFCLEQSGGQLQEDLEM
ncbi:MAG: caspase family protein, partial [Acidobacteriota bacterium]